MKYIKWMTLFLLALGLGLLPSVARADSFSVSVGYIDTLRASGFTPTPFCSSFALGSLCQANGATTFDSGVFRIDNTGATSLVISNITVELDPGTFGFTFSLWGNVTIGAGQTAFFGQTSGQNFDTSDFGVVGTDAGIGINGIGGCTTPSALSAGQQALCAANAPIISFEVNGTPFSFTDSGQIINTGNYDFVCCSSDGNESIKWNLIGQTGTRGGTTPEPASLLLLGTGLLGVGFARRYFA